jgi:hypothetical protein
MGLPSCQSKGDAKGSNTAKTLFIPIYYGFKRGAPEKNPTVAESNSRLDGRGQINDILFKIGKINGV